MYKSLQAFIIILIIGMAISAMYFSWKLSTSLSYKFSYESKVEKTVNRILEQKGVR